VKGCVICEYEDDFGGSLFADVERLSRCIDATLLLVISYFDEEKDYEVFVDPTDIEIEVKNRLEQ
jgi:hypothetical protein